MAARREEEGFSVCHHCVSCAEIFYKGRYQGRERPGKEANECCRLRRLRHVTCQLPDTLLAQFLADHWK